MRFVIASAVIVAGLAGCGEPDPAVGKVIYDQTCDTCHGPDGKQGTLSGGTAAADLTVEVPDPSDDQLESITIDGFGDMPAQNVDPKDVPDLIAYLREQFP